MAFKKGKGASEEVPLFTGKDYSPGCLFFLLIFQLCHIIIKCFTRITDVGF
jgi:hypothetical protein